MPFEFSLNPVCVPTVDCLPMSMSPLTKTPQRSNGSGLSALAPLPVGALPFLLAGAKARALNGGSACPSTLTRNACVTAVLFWKRTWSNRCRMLLT